MSALQLRQKIKKEIDELETHKLRAAENLISALRSSPGLTASDLRKIAKMHAAIAEADEDFASGRGVAVESLKRKY